MSVNEEKDRVQKEALNCWVRAGCRGTLEAATAFGKTRCGVLAISHYAKQANYVFKALIVTPTVAIQQEWIKEFKNWGESRVLTECVEIYCINTARTFEEEFYDILVADEIHNYPIGEINSRLFNNNKFKMVLGLSASIDSDVQEALLEIAPVCYTLNVYDALALGLISNFTVYNIAVRLSDSEQEEYNRLTKAIDYHTEMYRKPSWKNVGLRKTLLYKASGKMKVINQISDKYKDTYGIVFSQTKDYANEVKDMLGDICLPHHSGLNAKSRIANLKKFADGRTKIKRISSARTLDEGVTLPRLEFAVISSGSSKPKQQIQRVGRVCRLGPANKHAIVIRLYAENTVEENWINSAQRGFKIININSVKDIES
jgi:superfamily II DNA or RNA helicase